jgi:virginiamycin A acetyltransferase
LRIPENFERNVLYHFDFIGDKLIIGKFCAIASDVKFIMNGGNHRTDWFTNYPFPVFGHGWESAMPEDWPQIREIPSSATMCGSAMGPR